jgi:hypothetical protein
MLAHPRSSAPFVLTLFVTLTVFALLTSASFPARSPVPIPAAAAHLPEVGAFDLLTATEGWLLLDSRLYWTRTGGTEWADITPPDLGQSVIRAVSFIDTEHGWLVLTDTESDGISYLIRAG